MNTSGHYAHLLLIVVLGAILFYAVLRQWLPPLSAGVGAVALLLGKPTFHIAAGLMHGHYATGFAFSMLAILGWTRYLRGGKWQWIAFSVLAYLLATTCKEVYVPLVVILPFLPAGTLRQRIRGLLPFVLVAIFYTGWRYFILGAFVGGYSEGKGFNFENAAHQLIGIPELLVGSKISGIFLITCFTGLFFLAFIRKRLNFPLLAVAFFVVFLPLLPLTAFPGIHQSNRYLFIPWLALSACLAAVLPRQTRFIPSATLASLLILVLIATHIQGRKETREEIAFWDTAYRFAISADKTQQALFIGPDDGYKRSVLAGARYAADLINPDAAPGTLQIVDESGNGRLTYIKSMGMKIFEFADGKMLIMSKERLTEKFPHYAHLQPSKKFPLEVNLTLKAGILKWKFGPYDGKYLVNILPMPVPPNTEFILSREGQTNWSKEKPLKISFCYNNEQKNIFTCSPVLIFDFSTSEIAEWHGLSHSPVVQ